MLVFQVGSLLQKRSKFLSLGPKGKHLGKPTGRLLLRGRKGGRLTLAAVMLCFSLFSIVETPIYSNQSSHLLKHWKLAGICLYI